MSEFVNKYTSFWGVPIQGEVMSDATDRPELIVSYKIEILEGYDRIVTNKTEVVSPIPDGGNCGIELTIGIPQFLNVYDIGDGQFGMSSCTPHIPYKAIKDYLQNGVDANVPASYDCLDENNEINLENTDCAIWENAANEFWQRRGDEDWVDYLVSWREQKLESLIPR